MFKDLLPGGMSYDAFYRDIADVDPAVLDMDIRLLHVQETKQCYVLCDDLHCAAIGRRDDDRKYFLRYVTQQTVSKVVGPVVQMLKFSAHHSVSIRTQNLHGSDFSINYFAYKILVL